MSETVKRPTTTYFNLIGVVLLILISALLYSVTYNVPQGYKLKVLGAQSVLSKGIHFITGMPTTVMVSLTPEVGKNTLGMTMKKSITKGNVSLGLGVTFDITYKYSVSHDDDTINLIFAELGISPDHESPDDVFKAYIDTLKTSMLVDMIERHQLTSSDDISEINKNITLLITEYFTDSPLMVTDVVVSNIKADQSVVTQVENIKKELKNLFMVYTSVVYVGITDITETLDKRGASVTETTDSFYEMTVDSIKSMFDKMNRLRNEDTIPKEKST